MVLWECQLWHSGEDPMLLQMWCRSQLWLGFRTWPRSFHMPWKKPNTHTQKTFPNCAVVPRTSTMCHLGARPLCLLNEPNCTKQAPQLVCVHIRITSEDPEQSFSRHLLPWHCSFCFHGGQRCPFQCVRCSRCKIQFSYRLFQRIQGNLKKW